MPMCAVCPQIDRKWLLVNELLNNFGDFQILSNLITSDEGSATFIIVNCKAFLAKGKK